MTKRLIEVTEPLDLELAKEIKRDVEGRGSRAYLTIRNIKGLGKRFIVWREPDEEDKKNKIKPKKVSTGELYNHNLKSLV